MMRSLAATAALAASLAVVPIATGCASSRTRGPDPDERGTLRIGGSASANVEITRTLSAYEDGEPVDPARAWEALPLVYRALGLPVNQRDAAAHRIGVAGLRPRRIEDQPLSRYLECGRGITAGPLADAYQVDLWVDTRVVPDAGHPGKATLATSVTANATPVASQGNTVTCESTGKLERRIAELVHQRLTIAP